MGKGIDLTGKVKGTYTFVIKMCLINPGVLFFSWQILEEYNDTHTPMNLVLFDDALDHLTRIHRVIRMDRGHALLVGVGKETNRMRRELFIWAREEVGVSHGIMPWRQSQINLQCEHIKHWGLMNTPRMDTKIIWVHIGQSRG